MDRHFEKLIREDFAWFPEKGMGHYPVKETPYDEAYFKKYQGYASTELGQQLNRARISFVNSFYAGFYLVDVGIGCGQFISGRNRTAFGFDVNPVGIKWLNDRGLFLNPYEQEIEAATFWDSLEHIEEPAKLLKNVSQWVFVSLPIFKDCDHVLKSKHFRKDEHIWYWTQPGFMSWMHEQGFSFQAHSTFEMDLGREDIQTFAFKRKENP